MNHHLNCRAWLTLFAGFVLGVFLMPGSVGAITLTPTRFEVSGNPGDVLEEEILLINETTLAETFYPAFANFEAQGESGSPAFVDPREGLGTWITAGIGPIRLGPGEQKIVPFKITIPMDAEPGGHFAVVFFSTSPPGGSGISVGSQTGILVLLSVMGDVQEEAGLLNFNTVGKKFFYQTLPVEFEYRFRNDGGDRVKPSGTLTVRNTLFLPTERLDGNPVEGNVLPNSTRKIIVNWQKYQRPNEYVVPGNFFSKFSSDLGYQWRNFALGLYSAKLDVAYGTHGEHAKARTWFFVFPWQLVLVLAVAISTLYWGGKSLIRRYNSFIIRRAGIGIDRSSPSSNG